MSELLTHSRLRAFRKCPRYEFLTYGEAWRAVKEDENLAFGTLWHTGMEAWWNCHKDSRQDQALAMALAATADRALDPFAQIRCEELLRGYDARWGDQDYTVLDVEREFRAPLINPKTMQPSRTWRLAGKVDVRILNGGGRLLITEHKTSSEDIRPAADYWLKLQMDHQLSIYTVGAETLGPSPEGCLYDVVYKPAHRPLLATPVEDRKYTKKENKLYANQREHDETPDEYRARVREAIEEDPERFFQRREIPRIESQLRDFLQDAWAQGRNMREAYLAGRAPRNPDACFNMGKCLFWEVCSTGMDPAEHPDKFRRAAHPHEELTLDVAA